MSGYRDRTGQRIGRREVLADVGRTKRGEVIWRVLDHDTGREKYLTTWRVIRLATLAGVPAPPATTR